MMLIIRSEDCFRNVKSRLFKIRETTREITRFRVMKTRLFFYD